MSVRLIHSVESKEVSNKDRLVETLREMLRESFRLRNEGAPYAKLTHCQGCVDGYMRALTGANIVDDRELLLIVAEERRGVNGPPTRTVSLEPVGASA